MRVLSLVLCLLDIYHESIIVDVVFTGYIPWDYYRRWCCVYWIYTIKVLSLVLCLLDIYHKSITVGSGYFVWWVF